MNILGNTETTNNNNNKACAACKFRRRKCDTDCILAPYFPPDRPQQFLNAHKLFGVKNITTIIENLSPHDRDQAMRTVIYESDMRAKDPVGGCFRYIQQLQYQIEYHQVELEFVLQQVAIYRAQAHHHLVPDVTNTDYQYNPIASSHYHYLQLPQQLPQDNHNDDDNDIPFKENIDNALTMHDSMSLSSYSTQNNGGGNDYVGDALYQHPRLSYRNELGIEHQGSIDRSDRAVLFGIDTAVLKTQVDSIQQVEDLDKKGAASLFTLTNCTNREVST